MQDRAEQLGDKVIYQIYVRSFNDSNGDGIGDLKGITERLDYLKRLGVDYLWITPFFVSPQNDNGYDVANYREVDPMFGTMDDFGELSREARTRGIGLMLDMVFNHTSTSHQWFQKALTGDPKYLAYYKFVDAAPGATADNPGKPPTNWVSKFGGNAWEYVPSLNKWYLHLFDVSQADLNWDNPEVRSRARGCREVLEGQGCLRLSL
jgi:trehalose-6-phosphate hydrolase